MAEAAADIAAAEAAKRGIWGGSVPNRSLASSLFWRGWAGPCCQLWALSKEARGGVRVALSNGEPCLFSHVRECKMGIVFSDPLWLARGAGLQERISLYFLKDRRAERPTPIFSFSFLLFLVRFSFFLFFFFRKILIRLMKMMITTVILVVKLIVQYIPALLW